MKMPEKHDLPAAIPAGQRNKASGQSLRLQWRTFMADIMAVRLQTVIDATMRHYRLVYSGTLLDFRCIGEQSRLYNERVYRLHRY